MLADAINFPLVGAWGLAIFGPLTLLVTLIECAAFRVMLKVTFRSVFRRVLVANIVSTLAGGIAYAFQDIIVHATGITASIPQFVSGYAWVAGLLVFIYFAKSLLVESLVVATRSVADRIGRKRRGIVKALVVGNVLSYSIVGPLFFFATHPTFGGVELLPSTEWTANGDQTVYFIDPDDHFIKRIQADGTKQETVVPFSSAAFLMSGDHTAFAYRATGGSLFLYRSSESAPVLAWRTDQQFPMAAVSVSPNQTKVAFAVKCLSRNGDDGTLYRLRIFDVVTQKTVDTGYQTQEYMWPSVAWSRDGKRVYIKQEDSSVAICRAESPWDVVETREVATVDVSELAVEYKRPGIYWLMERDRSGPYEAECWLGLGAHIRVTRDEDTVLGMMNDYGLLKLGLPGPSSPSFLPNGCELLIEWLGQLYVLDVENRRLGLLTSGDDYLVPISRFLLRFAE